MNRSLLFIKILLAFTAIPAIHSYSQTEDSNQSCTVSGCHLQLISENVLHSPIEDDCLICHETSGENHPRQEGKEFVVSEEVPVLCYQCHDEHNTLQFIHTPVEEGECLVCHSPHSSSQSFMLVSPEGENVCNDCHDLDLSGIIHQPVGQDHCVSCHEPHASENEILLKKTVPQLCLECHEKQKGELQFKTVHPPFEESCLNCHHAHYSKNKHLLVSKSPEICLNCHDAGAEIDTVHTVHGPIRSELICGSCHSPHASDQDNLFKKNSFDICLDCHSEEIEFEKRIIKNISLSLQSKNILHAPVEDEGCPACHSLHSSQKNYLLNNDFPPGLYTKGETKKFSLCFDCHDSDLLQIEFTTDATDFRMREKNLHYVHVNRNKGRNCNLCHDIHGSNQPYLIAESVSYGKWKMPLIFKEAGNGGSCIGGCHPAKSYQR